jgi:hypothetical protein
MGFVCAMVSAKNFFVNNNVLALVFRKFWKVIHVYMLVIYMVQSIHAQPGINSISLRKIQSP